MSYHLLHCLLHLGLILFAVLVFFEKRGLSREMKEAQFSLHMFKQESEAVGVESLPRTDQTLALHWWSRRALFTTRTETTLSKAFLTEEKSSFTVLSSPSRGVEPVLLYTALDMKIRQAPRALCQTEIVAHEANSLYGWRGANLVGARRVGEFYLTWWRLRLGKKIAFPLMANNTGLEWSHLFFWTNGAESAKKVVWLIERSDLDLSMSRLEAGQVECNFAFSALDQSSLLIRDEKRALTALSEFRIARIKHSRLVWSVHPKIETGLTISRAPFSSRPAPPTHCPSVEWVNIGQAH